MKTIFRGKKIFRFIFTNLFFIFLLSFAFAQTKTKLTIHFESDSYTLTGQAQKSIDSVLRVRSFAGANCRISIVGFTDSTGDLEHNKQLSNQRSLTTADYFKSKGFSRTEYSGKASYNAVGNNSTEKGKYLNRRVEITFTQTSVELNKIGNVEPEDEKYKIDATQDRVIVEKSGTQLIIPANAFVDQNGNPVTGEIEISYREYRDAADFILADMPMNIPEHGTQQPFNSAGMFRIEATQNGQPLELAAGKNIDLNYAMEQDLPDMNLYKFDTIANQWKPMEQITDQNGNNVGAHNDAHGMRVCGWMGDQKTCLMGDDQGIIYIADAGIRYADSPEIISAEMKTYDSLTTKKSECYAALGYNKSQILFDNIHLDTLRQHKDRITHHYKIKKVSTGKGKTVFEIKCFADKNNEFTPVKKISWEYPSEDMTSLNDSIFKKKWDECMIMFNESNNDYEIYMKDNITGAATEIKDVNMVFPDKVKKKKFQQKEMETFSVYDSAYTVYANELAVIQFKHDSLIRNDMALQRKIDSLDKILSMIPEVKFPGNDSLFCFWSLSREYMSPEETKMTFSKWFEYFDANKPMMAKRYAALKKSKKYAEALQLLKERKDAEVQFEKARKLAEQKLEKTKAEQEKNNDTDQTKKSELNNFMVIGGSESNMKKGEDLNNEKTIFRSLSISSMGVYNYDQISRFRSPIVTVDAAYQDENKKPLNIILMYIADSSFNGIMRYDGLEGMTPQVFNYSASSRTTMIAFDENFTAYTFTSEQFAKINPGNGTISYTFTLKKMKNVNSHAELEQAL
ncbi:MAG: OmpA family protein [Bacteroidetes bacterium]|nr:OmpA family protein [Bacteroidota bacterium]